MLPQNSFYSQLLKSFKKKEKKNESESIEPKKKRKEKRNLEFYTKENNIYEEDLKISQATDKSFVDPYAISNFKQFSKPITKNARKELFIADEPEEEEGYGLSNKRKQKSSINFENLKEDAWFNHFNGEFGKGKGVEEAVKKFHQQKGELHKFHTIFKVNDNKVKIVNKKIEKEDPIIFETNDPNMKALRSKSLKDLTIENDLKKRWLDYLMQIPLDVWEEKNDDSNIKLENNKEVFFNYNGFRNEFQQHLFNVLNNYNDLFLSCREYDKIIDPKESKSFKLFQSFKKNEATDQLIRETYVLHMVNHLIKTKRYQWYNDKKRRIRFKEYNVKDSGFVNPKILVIVPFKYDCFEILNLFRQLFPKVKGEAEQNMDDEVYDDDETNFENMEDTNDGDWHKWKLFNLVFGSSYIKKKRNKKEWKREMFKGNIEDKFSLGITYHKNGTVEFFTKEEDSDIIIATVLGLHDKRPYELSNLLSSVEMCIIDRPEIIDLLQNWDYLTQIASRINYPVQSIPDNGNEIARIRNYFIEGYGKHFRQTLVFSSNNSLNLDNLFFKCSNLRNKVRIKKEHKGIKQKKKFWETDYA